MSDYNTELLRELARRVIIAYPKYKDMDGGPDANGLNFTIDMYCELPGKDGALWKQVRHFMAVNMPGLLDRTPSPDNVLRRGREVKQEMKALNQVQPVLHHS